MLISHAISLNKINVKGSLNTLGLFRLSSGDLKRKRFVRSLGRMLVIFVRIRLFDENLNLSSITLPEMKLAEEQGRFLELEKLKQNLCEKMKYLSSKFAKFN